MRGWALAALDLVFPALCPVCQRRLGPGRRDPLCAACWQGIVRVVGPVCDRCGRSLPSGASRAECGACASGRPAFDYARSAAWFSGPLRDAVHALKFRGTRALARPLADLVAEQVGALPADVDALVPVPLAPERERERGFNQAELLAGRLAARWRLPSRPRWLCRVRAMVAQTELGAEARCLNVHRAFRATPAAEGRHVVLVDDVLTTGATAAECARALRAAGARTVGVVTVARVV